MSRPSLRVVGRMGDPLAATVLFNPDMEEVRGKAGGPMVAQMRNSSLHKLAREGDLPAIKVTHFLSSVMIPHLL